jgi:glycosyltransferase involved in cell wall biosynthesis
VKTVVRSIHAPRSLRWSTPKAQGWTVPTLGLARKLIGRDVLVLPALVDASFTPRPSHGGEGRPGARIGMVSTFQPSRRHALGLEAFALVRARVPHATLDLIGDGALEPSLRAQALRHGEAIAFRGYLAGPAFIEALQSLDEVWVLGLGNDFSGRAAAQARACGARVLSVDEGALEKWADVLVEPTCEAIAAAALSAERREVRVESTASVTGRVLELYARARSP